MLFWTGHDPTGFAWSKWEFYFNLSFLCAWRYIYAAKDTRSSKDLISLRFKSDRVALDLYSE